MSGHFHHIGIAELSRLISSKQVSPVEVTDHFLERIETLDRRLNSFILVTSELARKSAKAAEAEIIRGGYRGALHGIPFGLKDVYDVKGLPTTAQSHALASNLAAEDSSVAQRLLDAGAILLGKNATWEFTYGQPSEHDLFPPARNPWNTDHDPEGSSSGSAAAVAAGLCPISIGSDTGGSIRDPAAGCGVVGLKPTFGRVSRYGATFNSFSHDHCGPLTWSVEDCAIVLRVLAGHDPNCVASAREPVPDYRACLGKPIKGLRLGVVRDWFTREVQCTDEMLAAFEGSITVLTDLGATVKDVSLPSLQSFASAKKVIATAELFAVHSVDLRERPHLLGKSLRYLIMAGALITAQDYLAACRWRLELAREMAKVFSHVDVLVQPTMAAPAPKLEPMQKDGFLTGERSYTTPFNVSGYPALSICNGFASSGMPLSLQIAGRPFEEATVLQVAHALEQTTSYRERRPALFQ